MRFSQYILESNGNSALNEKMGNLNASNDTQYSFLLKAVLKNKSWRGLVGPNSKIVTLTGTGRTQFIKDLRDIEKKMDNLQLIFLTTENKTVMIKNNDDGKYDESTNSHVPNPISLNLHTADITVAHVPAWERERGPVLPKAEISNHIVSAKGRNVQRRLKDSLDEAALDDKTAYHAVVILPDLENKEKEAQRHFNKYSGSGDKYGQHAYADTSSFMHDAKQRAVSLRKERAALSYNSHTMTFRDVYNILGDTNSRVIIDGVVYEKLYYDKITGGGYKFLVTSGGVIHICRLEDSTQKYQTLVYDVNVRRFIIE